MKSVCNGRRATIFLLTLATPMLARAAAEAAKVEPTGFAWALVKMNEGGIFMWFIFIGLIFLVLLTLERFFALNFKLSVNGERLYDTIEENVKAGNIGAAKEACETVGKTALGQILLSALDKAGQSEKIIQDAVDEADLRVAPQINARTGYLSMIANVSTLLGLLGTIIGLIQAFASLAQADPSQKQVALANGISIAMNTTAFGLIVAIPGMVIFALLMGKTNKLVEDIDLYSVKTINLLSQRGGKG